MTVYLLCVAVSSSIEVNLIDDKFAMQYEMPSYCRDTIRQVASKIVQVQMVECCKRQKGRQIDDSFCEKYKVAELHDIMLLCSTILKNTNSPLFKMKNADT